MGHAGEHDTLCDGSPDTILDAQLTFNHQVHDIAWQPGSGDAAVQPVHHPVVPLYQRIRTLMVGQPGKDHVHVTTMRTQPPPRLLVFRPAHCAR